MKITAIKPQKRYPNRVNVSVDGCYRFSLDVYQLVELGLSIGYNLDESELDRLETESQFGKLYARAVDYCLMRPHSAKEVKDYLYRKTLSKRGKDGRVYPGVTTALTLRVFDRLVEKNYIDDDKFASFWIENRKTRHGISRRKIVNELMSKGIDPSIIDQQLTVSGRNDAEEIQKVVAKKRHHYQDDKKMIAYLARQGFSYDDIKEALAVAID